MKVSRMLTWFREAQTAWAGAAHTFAPTMWFALLYFAVVMALSFRTEAFPPVIVFFIFAFVGAWVFSHSEKISKSVSSVGRCSWSGKKVWILVATVYSLLVLFAPWPSQSPDVDWQWAQAIGARPFDDWHPVVHTWTIALLQRIVRRYRLVVLVQSILFSFAMWLMLKTLVRWSVNQKWALLTVMAVAFSPFTLNLIRILWKDSAFGLCVLIMSIMLVNIVESKGAWLNWKRVVALAILIAYASFVRHNGIFYTIPLLVLLPWATRKLYSGKVLCTMGLAVIFLVGYVGLRRSLKSGGLISESLHNQNFAESVGLPMSMMSESYVVHPERTPKETCDFLEGFCDRDHWMKYYEGDYNSVKFSIPTSQFIERMTAIQPREFALMFAKTVKQNPVSCVKSFLFVTQPAWAPCPDGLNSLPRGKGAFGMRIRALQDLIIKSAIGNVVAAPGCVMLVFVIAFLWCLQRDRKRAMIYFLPVASYHFGTMLFLTGWDWRFFFPTILVAYPLSLMLVKK